MAKNAVAVRLPEDTIELMNAVALERGYNVSDFVRDGLYRLFQQEAKESDAIATALRETAQGRLDKCAEDITAMCGPEILQDIKLRQP